MATIPKPFDFGELGITGSVDSFGRFIAINFYHPVHGLVTLTSADPFPDSERYNPAVVRAYRASLARLTGFGIHVDASSVNHAADRGDHIHQQVTGSGVSWDVMTFAHEDHVTQWWQSDQPSKFTFGGKYTLMRCAYTQLTEGGVLPMPPTDTTTIAFDGVLLIENPAIGVVAVGGIPDAEPSRSAKLIFAFALTRKEALQKVRQASLSAWRPSGVSAWRAALPDDPLFRRGIEYSIRMGIPVDDGLCLLTDHMLLPLSWNRDAYYLARALLSWHVELHDFVRRHLIWMFELADRVDGAWGRCYLANGRVKDAAFQLDQQLFPLLELAEYVLETGDHATWERLKPHALAVLSMLERRRAASVPLYPTDETPGDDPIAQPYHLSSHILFWVTLNKLNRLGVAQESLAQAIRDAVPRYFTADHDGKLLYAYATDGHGGFHFYHDANDFPTVLAPVWGFCDSSDPLWRATIEFAFSDANQDGFYNGRLGSVHTRAPWALGDIQELILARLLNDPARAAKARSHLAFAAQQDGSLPEAYDAVNGEVVSRTWFAWTNAAYACVELRAFRA